MNLIFIPNNRFKEMYEWCKEQFGTSRNMLFKTGDTSAVWTVERTVGITIEYTGHIFMFDNDQDLIKFRNHFGVEE